MKPLVFTILFILLLIPLSSVSAQQQTERKFNGIIIQPAIEFLEVDRSEVTSGTIRLTNDFEQEQTITLYPIFFLFSQSGESGEPDLYLNPSLPESADGSKWFDTVQESVTLQQGEFLDVEYVVNVPIDAEPGGHYVAVIFSEDENLELTDVTLNRSIGTLFFLNVSGDVQTGGELIEFRSVRNWYDFTPFEFETRYRNDGNTHDVIGGNIFIHRGDITNPTGEIEVNSNGQVVLPGLIRSYLNTFNGGLISRAEDGTFRIDLASWRQLYLGEYDATLKLFHDSPSGERTISEKTISFWVIPWQLIFPMLVALLLLVIYFTYRRRNNPRKNA